MCSELLIRINTKNTVMKNLLGIKILILAFIFMTNTNKSFGHCEIPCGIYGDSLRIELISEHIETIEKSMTQIILLSEEKEVNYNQLVRWVQNKEKHATEIQEIVSQYFLHQRIKAKSPSDVEAYAKYTNQLALLHQITVSAMKAKQTTDLKYIESLRNDLKKFSDSYFHTHSH